VRTVPARLATSVAVGVVVAGLLAGCAGVPAPPGPSAGQLHSLVSRAEGLGSNGYSDFGVSVVRYISAREWQGVMTSCIRTNGITNVDFEQLTPGPYSYPAAPQGNAALERALGACSLEYPLASLRSSLRTARQWNYEYTYLVNEFVPCLRGVGALVGGLPTRAGYVAAATQSSGVPSAYRYVTRRPSAVPQSVLEARCPATAPGL
jgi:hypothetical protein